MKDKVSKAAVAGGKFAYNFAMDELVGRAFGMLKIQILFPVLFFSVFSWAAGLVLGYLIWG